MRYLPLIASVLMLCGTAKADKFWLSDPKAEQNAAAGSSPNLIEGVLLAEDAEGYHIRVEGGEIVLPKKSVFKVEKGDLSLDKIVQAEKDSVEAGELANQERRLVQATQAREREVQVAEASASRTARAVDAGASRSETVLVPAAGFDPVVGVATGYNSQFEMMRDAQLAWTMTKDRRYLQLLRQLRRLR
jgi:hypothetical protein